MAPIRPIMPIARNPPIALRKTTAMRTATRRANNTGSAGCRWGRLKQVLLSISVLTLVIMLSGCQELLRNTQSILIPRFQRSDIFGFVAGLGTTFAVLPDLVGMLRRRSSAGMNPRMAAITGVFQILWVYYGILIISRPVVAWNVIGVLINFFSVGAYSYFLRKEKAQAASRAES
jgi:MtN3 and saliva related transmembrane protein